MSLMDSLQHVMTFFIELLAMKESKTVNSSVRKSKALKKNIFFSSCCALSLDRFGTISPVRTGKPQVYILCKSLTLGFIYLHPSYMCAAWAWLVCAGGAVVLWPRAWHPSYEDCGKQK